MPVLQELVSAWRRLRRQPVSAAGIVITLALGIAISVSMFSVLHAVALRALPYPDAERIVTIHAENLEQAVPRAAFTTSEARELLAGVPGFAHTAYSYGGQATFVGGETPLLLSERNVSAGYFSVFGVPAALGRTLVEADFTENPRVVVLNHAAWLAVMGGDPEAVGRSLGFQEGSFEVVGVLPEWFEQRDAGPLIYLPQRDAPDGLRYQSAVGRLASGVSPALSEETLQARLAAIHAAHGVPRGWRVRQVSLIDELVGDVRKTLIAVFGAALLVLMVACSATASLVAIRLEERTAELAVRRALGASDARIALDISVELLVLVAVAAVGGVLLACLAIELVRPLAAGVLPRADDIAIDTSSLAFAAAATGCSVLFSGFAPLLRALRRDAAERLRGGVGREVTGARRIALLPALGVGLSTAGLVTALALALSLMRLGDVDPGFRTENIVALTLFRDQTSRESNNRFLERAIEELRAVPGVRDVSTIGGSPPTARSSGGTPMEITAPGATRAEPILARTRWVWDGYHGMLGIPLRQGRDISSQDTSASRPVIVINETLAQQAFGGADPIGRTVMVSLGPQPVPFEVVGVAADTRNAGLEAPVEPEVMFALRQASIDLLTLLVDFAVTPPSSMRTLEEAVWRADPDQPIQRSFALTDDLAAQTERLRFFAAATAWFAVLALLLGAAGINAVVAAMQRRCAREIGLRMALGAAPRDAAALVLTNAARILGIGLGKGGLFAGLVLIWLRDDLFGVGGGAVAVLFGLTVLVLIGAGLAAACGPARRASRVAPIEALRCG